MAEIKNTFIKGSMNKDLDERLIPDGQYVDALNIDVETTEGQDAGAAKNKLGNSLIVDLNTLSGEDATTAQTIGAVEYEAENKIYWIVTCDTFDGIYEYDAAFDISSRVLQSNKATPSTASKLNLNKKYPITGINFIKGQDGNDFLYWTDDYNPPRRINISRAKSYAIDDAKIDSDIDVIIEPPLFAPSIELFNDNSTVQSSNNMSEKFLYFSYRFKYVDDQYSSMSPFSAVSFLPKEYNYDYSQGNNKSMTNFFNSVNISFETGNEFVEEIQVLVRDTRNINVSIIDSYNKKELGIPNDSSYSIEFNNNKIYAAISNEQVTRLFDNVPLLAKAQDIVGNRLAYGNYLQFRDIVDLSGNDILINYDLSLLNDSSVTETNPKPTWRSDRDYEIGLVYLDDYGRMTTVLNGVNPTYNSINIAPDNSDKANSIKLTIKNNPPYWATHYRVYVKQAKKSYYNIFPIIYYKDGNYRYFLINDADLNKLKVGEYVIFKTKGYGPTYSNKKYRILEITQKNENFVSGAIRGVYFKVKVDLPSELDPSLATNLFWQFRNGTDRFNVQVPVYNGFSFVENPIYYGENNADALIRVSQYPIGSTKNDYRFTIEAINSTTFRYTSSFNLQGASWSSDQTIVIGSDITLSVPGDAICKVRFASNPAPGDIWKVNVRGFNGDLALTKNYFGANGIRINDDGTSPGIIPASFSDPGGYAPIEVPEAIGPGDIITIKIAADTKNSSAYTQTQTFISSGRYENIEEWFVEDGAYQNFINTGPINGYRSVSFRRGVQRTDITSFTGNYLWSSINQKVPGSTLSLDDYPMCIIIKGNGVGDQNQGNRFAVELTIKKVNKILICETIPVEEDADIYHELLQTYPIVDGLHKVLWSYDSYADSNGNTKLVHTSKSVPHYFNVGDSVKVTTSFSPINGIFEVVDVEDLYSIVIDAPYSGTGASGTVSLEGVVDQDQTTTAPAIIQINKPNTENSDFNAWCWGNGLESDRIYDDFNDTTKGFSPRVQTPIEDYKQIRSEASICYSGVYQNNSSLNRLNEFNLSISNFKYLDREFGSIQKLYARDTDIVVFQENKVSTVLYGKNILFDSVGGGQIVSVPEVLGTQVPMSGEWGISKNPESFAKWADSVWFTDLRRGSVLQMTSNQIMEISSLGMSDYFRDLMRDNPLTLKLGAYDPHNHMYVLSAVDKLSSASCQLSITPSELVVVKGASTNKLLFKIISNTSWTISLVNNGYGTGWVTNIPTSGTGSQDITANISASGLAVSRSLYIVIEYCDGEKIEFFLKQQNGNLGDVSVFAYSNETPALNQ